MDKELNTHIGCLGGAERQVTLAALTSAMRAQSNIPGQVLRVNSFSEVEEMIERGPYKCLEVSEGRVSRGYFQAFLSGAK